jgi:trehalose/maltose hydrolase-like predicted phosphorylase
MTQLSGFSGEHPERKIEAAAFAPYPIAGDISLDGVWMSETSQNVRIIDQACDFSTGELTTRLAFHAGGHRAKIAVMAFCSRDQPTLVCQEISLEVDGACDIRVRAKIDLSGIEGRALRYNRDTPGKLNHRVTAHCFGRARAQYLHAASPTSLSCLEIGQNRSVRHWMVRDCKAGMRGALTAAGNLNSDSW